MKYRSSSLQQDDIICYIVYLSLPGNGVVSREDSYNLLFLMLLAHNSILIKARNRPDVGSMPMHRSRNSLLFFRTLCFTFLKTFTDVFNQYLTALIVSITKHNILIHRSFILCFMAN